MNIFIRTSIAQYRVDAYNVLAEKYNFKMCFFDEEDDDQHYSDNVIKNRLRFIPFYIKGPKICHKVKLFWGLFSLIRREKPKFIIVPEFKLCALQALFYKMFLENKPRIISMCDDSYDMIVNNKDFSLMHRFARRIVTPLLDDIILADKYAVEWYQKKYLKGIWLPIIMNESYMKEKYQEIIPLSNIINKEFHLEGKKVILFVGRLVKIKNITQLIRAVKIMHQNAILVIVGDGVERANLVKLADKSNNIIFTGKLSGNELYAWYNISDVFSLISTQEPFGAVVNEALLAGNKCVISCCVGAKCLINDYNGIIVDPNNINDIANSLDKLIKKIAKKSNEIFYKGNLMQIKFSDIMNRLGENEHFV